MGGGAVGRGLGQSRSPPLPGPRPPHPHSALRSLRGWRGCRSLQGWKHHQAGETRWEGAQGRNCQEDAAGSRRPSPERWRPGPGEGRHGGGKT